MVIRCFLGAYVLLAAVCVFGVAQFLMAGTRIVRLQSEIGRVSAEIESIKEEQGMTSLEKEWSVLNGRLDAARRMLERKTSWSRNLSDLAALLPQGICIRDISSQDSSKTTTVRLAVVSMAKEEYEEVNDYISALEKRSGFGKGIRLESHEKNKLEGRAVEFYGLTLPGKTEPVTAEK